MHIISRGQKGDNKFVLTSLNEQFPTERSSRAKFSRSTIGNRHAVPSVHLRHYAHLDSFKHPILAPFSPPGSFSFWLSNVCTECWKPLCSAVSALFIQLPAGFRVAFISGSELTNADTEIIHPVKNSLTRLICGRSPQPLPCTALQQRIGIIYDWHNHKIALSAHGVCSPRGSYPIPQGARSSFPNWAWLLCSAHPPPSVKGQSWRTVLRWGRRLHSFSIPWSWQPCSQHSILW